MGPGFWNSVFVDRESRNRLCVFIWRAAALKHLPTFFGKPKPRPHDHPPWGLGFGFPYIFINIR